MTVTSTRTASVKIDSTETRRLLADEPAVRIIDVRTGGEFASCHIPGSYNVPLDTLPHHADELARLDHQVVLVCKSGARADQAKMTLTNAGMSDLRLLDGGIDAWQATGGETNSTGDSKWALDRQVRLVAGSISLAGILASIAAPKAKWLSGGVAAGLTFSAVSNTCAMGTVLSKLPYNRSASHDTDSVMASLRSANELDLT